jgi:Mn-dependent DtxR family transcriptional regulator
MSAFDFTDLLDVDHIRLHLGYGVHNAVTQKELARRTGIGLRAVQEVLEGMKRAGLPIVTGSAGVWLSNDAGELRAFYRANRRRIHTQWLNARGTLKAIAALERYYQETLFGEAA